MKKIKLRGGDVSSIVDDDMYEELIKYKWNLTPSGYAVAWKIINKTRKCRNIWMHRLVNKTPEGMQTDHINGNKLDNRRENLRSCTSSQNSMNACKFKNSLCKYKGVTKTYSEKLPFKAQIKINGKMMYLGSFKTEIEGAKLYNEMAKKHYGEFARLNEI